MTAALLYVASASAAAWLASRFVRRFTITSAVVLLLIPLCFTGRALLTGRVYGPIDLAFVTEPLHSMAGAYGMPAGLHNGGLSDVACQMIPWRSALKQTLHSGEWPLWNPYLFGGGPLAASAQPAVYSPFTLLACLLPIGTGTTYVATIWFFVAALSAFLFARELECRESVALFAAAAWPFCTSVAFFILWPLAQSWTLLPLVLLGVRRIATRPSFRDVGFLTVAFVLLIFAGHPETVLHIVFAGALYGAALISADRTHALRKIAYATWAGALALLLTAIYLLPVWEALRQTLDYMNRKVLATYEGGANATMTLVRLGIDFFPWMQVRRLLPALHITALPPTTAAAGSLVIALAIFAVWRVRSFETWFFSALLVLGIASGTNWDPIARAWKTLPLFDVSFNDYLAFAAAFSFVILATLALERAARGAAWRLLGINVAVVTIVLTIGALIIERAHLVQPNYEAYGDFRFVAEIAIPALAALLLILWRREAAIAIAGVIVLLLVQRTAEEGGVYPVLPAEAAYPPVPLLNALRDVREPFRIAGLGMAFIPGTSTMYGLEDVRGYTAMTFEPISRTWPLWSHPQAVWFNRVDDLDRPFLSFLNLRYAIVTSGEPDHAGWREVARQRGSKLLENTRVIERAFIPEEVVLDSRDPMPEMALATDFRKTAWITIAGERADQLNAAGTLRIQRRKLGFALDADMQRAGWIVVSEQGWRGWCAYIDGRRVPIHPANVAFLGIHVPRGKHVVEVRYWPESFVKGRAISFLTLVAVIAIVAAGRFRGIRVREGVRS